MLTTEEVRKALDLVPFEGYARKKLAMSDKDRMAEMVDNGDILLGIRSTGRTTRMLCSVLAAISSGRTVSIYARPMPAEQAIKDLAQEWAVKIGLNPKLIHGHLSSAAEIEFFDHTWYEPL